MSGVQLIGVIVLASFGSAFACLSAIGILTMPDLYTRIQAASKAGTLGAICVLLATAIYFSEMTILVRAGLVIGFLFLTTPIAAHQIARAGYLSGAPLEQGAVADALRGRYDTRTHALASPGQNVNDGRVNTDTK